MTERMNDDLWNDIKTVSSNWMYWRGRVTAELDIGLAKIAEGIVAVLTLGRYYGVFRVASPAQCGNEPDNPIDLESFH